METPDRWVVIKVVPPAGNDTYYRIMSSWYGGYLGSDSWKLSSGIENFLPDPDGGWTSLQTSGTVYRLYGNSYGMSSFAHGVYQGFVKQAAEQNATISIVPEEELQLLEKI